MTETAQDISTPAPTRSFSTIGVVGLGTMGAGKTTVGRLVAERLDLPFADSDHLVEERAGKSVQDIFVDDGEEHFRALEKFAPRVVLALDADAGHRVNAVPLTRRSAASAGMTSRRCRITWPICSAPG
mgnify:CR=1 FL=1